MSDRNQGQVNLETVIQIIRRASIPGFHGKVEIFFDDGKLRDQYKVESSLRTKKRSGGVMSKQEVDKVLDPVFSISS